MASNPRDKDCTPLPMPTTGTASRIMPTPDNVFKNEGRPPPVLGNMIINPGKQPQK